MCRGPFRKGLRPCRLSATGTPSRLPGLFLEPLERRRAFQTAVGLGVVKHRVSLAGFRSRTGVGPQERGRQSRSSGSGRRTSVESSRPRLEPPGLPLPSAARRSPRGLQWSRLPSSARSSCSKSLELGTGLEENRYTPSPSGTQRSERSTTGLRHLQGAGLPIGSGLAEGNCKFVRSGSGWKSSAAISIATSSSSRRNGLRSRPSLECQL